MFYRIAFVVIFLLYFSLSLYQIDLPGIHYDEAFEVVPALQLLLGQPVTTFRESGLVINQQRFPLMTQDYIGAINTYTALPTISIFGPTAFALRLPSVLIGAISLWLTHLLVSHLTKNHVAGLATIALLAVDPTFIFWNRQGVFVTAVTVLFGIGAIYFGLKRLNSKNLWFSVWLGFFVGSGIYAKFLFVWLIAAVLSAIVLLYGLPFIKNPPPLREQIGKFQFTLNELLLMFVAFIVGLSPLILYNLQTGGTFRNISENSQTSYYGVNNYNIGSNLIERLLQFGVLVDGSHLWYLGNIHQNSLVLPIFVLSLILVVVTVLFATRSAKLESDTKIALFPFLVIGLIIIASIQTVSALWVTHFAILMPWPAIALAISGWFILRHHPTVIPTAIIRSLIGLAFLTLITTNLANTIRYHADLTISGGLSTHSDAIYDLGDWLASQPNQPPSVVAMDWGLAAPIYYLTNGQVTPVEVFGYAWEPDVELQVRLERFIQEQNTYYLWRAPDEVIFDRSGEFKELYRPLNLEETIEEAFYERSGRPLLGITRIVPAGTAANPPGPE